MGKKLFKHLSIWFSLLLILSVVKLTSIDSKAEGKPETYTNKETAGNPDTQKPVISDVKVTPIPYEKYKRIMYEISCKVSDNVGLKVVQFPTWSEPGGKDDLVWHEATIYDGVAKVIIWADDHKGMNCRFITNIIAYDYAGNMTEVTEKDYECLAVMVGKGAEKLSKPVITELTNSSQCTMTVRYKAVKDRFGYSIEYSTNPKFQKNKTRVSTSSTVKKIGKLTKGNIYYVRVRAYAWNSSGKLIYSPWSATQRVKIKK